MKTRIELENPSPTEARPSSPRQLDTCRRALSEIERTRADLIAEFRPQVAPREHLLRLALNEAEGLAWQTDYPHLLFPALAAEKLESVAAWHTQQLTLQRTQAGLPLAA